MSEIKEERFFYGRPGLLSNPFFGPGREQIGGIALVEGLGAILIIFPDFYRTALRRFLGEIEHLLWVVLVAVHMAEVAVVVVEAALQGMGGSVRFKIETMHAPFANGPSRVTGLAQDSGQGMVFIDGFVELVVAHVGVSLRDALEQRGPRGSADWRCDIVMGESSSLGREAIEVGRELERKGAVAGSFAAVLVEYADIAPAQVVDQNEYDVWLG